MVDAADLKSASCKGVWVRVPPSALDYPDRQGASAPFHSVLTRRKPPHLRFGTGRAIPTPFVFAKQSRWGRQDLAHFVPIE